MPEGDQTTTQSWDPDADFSSAFQQLIAEVFRFHGMALAAGDRVIRDLGLSVGRAQAMAVIRNEPLTVAQISRRLGLARQSVQSNVNQLRKQGLVRTLDNPQHRRAPLITLTAAGAEIMAILAQRQADLAENFTAGLDITTEDLGSMSRKLRLMRETAARKLKPRR